MDGMRAEIVLANPGRPAAARRHHWYKSLRFGRDDGKVVPLLPTGR
jgi:hypothetical protein